MAIEDINVVHIESFERSFGSFDDMFPRQTLVVRTRPTPEDLGGDDDVGSAPAQLANRLTHNLLGSAIGVDLGVVEEVDSVITAALENRFGFFHVELVAESDPRSERERAHFQSRFTQILVLHFCRN